MLLVVIDVRSLFKFVPANCSARIFKPFSSGLISLLTLTSYHWTPRLLGVCQEWLVGAAPEASRLRWDWPHRVYAGGKQIVARHFPCVKYEDLPDILPHGGRDTGESSEPAQRLGDS